MVHMRYLILLALLSLSDAKVEISHSSYVLEDTWAEFSCTIKKHDTVKWRIGSFTDEGHIYNLGDRLGEIEGLQIEYVSTTISGNKRTEVIRILATMDLNGIPIGCMSESRRGKKYDEYSQFLLLEVMSSITTEGSGGVEITSRVKISHSSNILEGTWTEVFCTIKKYNTVKWRIGSFTDEGHIYNHGDRLGEIEGLEAEYVRATISGNKKTEVIRILATMDLNGIPIGCMSDSRRGKKYDEYSHFVLLEVMPFITTEGSGGMEMMSRERHSVPETEYTEEAISGEKQTVATSLLAVFSTIAATMARI